MFISSQVILVSAPVYAVQRHTDFAPGATMRKATTLLGVGLEHVPPELNRQDSHGVLDRRFYRYRFAFGRGRCRLLILYRHIEVG